MTKAPRPLTKAQRTMLSALVKVGAGSVVRRGHERTLKSLRKRGLVDIHYSLSMVWRPTNAGRQALQESE